jgi:hypothetical protein
MWLCVCYVVTWFVSMHQAPTQYTHNHILHGILSTKKPKSACNSEGTDELPEDGTQLPKHVGAAK